MAESHLIWTETGFAAANLQNAQYHFVRLTAANQQVNIASLDTHQTNWGVLQNRPTTNQHATVGLLGISKLVAGAATTRDAFLTTNSSGRAVDATSGDIILARGLEAAGADGDTITAEIFRPWRIWTAP